MIRHGVVSVTLAVFLPRTPPRTIWVGPVTVTFFGTVTTVVVPGAVVVSPGRLTVTVASVVVPRGSMIVVPGTVAVTGTVVVGLRRLRLCDRRTAAPGDVAAVGEHLGAGEAPAPTLATADAYATDDDRRPVRRHLAHREAGRGRLHLRLRHAAEREAAARLLRERGRHDRPRHRQRGDLRRDDRGRDLPRGERHNHVRIITRGRTNDAAADHPFYITAVG
jgi:hypothetical protein